jgi:nitrite reductase/ring-hydroxylating ferredoxin subunit
LVLHVAFGVLQSERNPLYATALGVGVATVLGLHVAAAAREARGERSEGARAEAEGFVRVCAISDLVEGRGHTVVAGTERLALFLSEGRVFALSNVCRHQGGPLGEGRIIDGCATCPWHGWQYSPKNGCSPPPFEEKVETYRVRVVDGEVLVDPRAAEPGTPQDGAPVGTEDE